MALLRQLRYRTDLVLSHGTTTLAALVAVSALAVTALAAALVAINPSLGGQRLSRHWLNLLAGLEAGYAPASAALLVLVVVLPVAALILTLGLAGLMLLGLRGRLADLARGRTPIAERGHTVVVGWSEQVFTIVSELMEATTGRQRICVAILADHDSAEMAAQIREKVRPSRRVRVLCRTGDPLDPGDLAVMNPAAAHAIIVLTPLASADPDAEVVKTLIAVANVPRRHGRDRHVVAAVTDTRNHATVRLAGGPATVLVDAEEITARLIVQLARQPGLSIVYQELFDFSGDEIYMSAQPTLWGTTYGQALHAFDGAALIGLRHHDGTVLINPPMDTPIGDDHQVIVIAQDSRAVEPANQPHTLEEAAITSREPSAPRPEHTLILGWNRRAEAVIRLMDTYAPAGSTLRVATDRPEAQTARFDLRHVTPTLDRLDVHDPDSLAGLSFQHFDHVIVLPQDGLAAQQADSRTLNLLLRLRDFAPGTVVCEMADDRNGALAHSLRRDILVVSRKLVTLVMTQLAQNPRLEPVFAHLLDAEGSEIYLRPATDYVRPDTEIDFHTILESCRSRGETAIGYRLHRERDRLPMRGITLNPPKGRRFRLDKDDHVIVLAPE